MADDSEFVRHIPCAACGSSDANAEYTDGHQHCFSCGAYVHGDGTEGIKAADLKSADLLPLGEPSHISARKLSEDTCRKWAYTMGTMGGEPVQIANYKDEQGRVIAQKVRGRDKQFKFLGKGKKVSLYGQWLWRDGGKMVVVTEGELDALSVSQAQGNKWPVVSVPHGSDGAAKDLAKNIQWLSGFDRVVLMLDNDEPGREATEECAMILPPGKAYIAHLPDDVKDASDMIVAGRTKDLIDCIWGAKEYRPDGIVMLSDLTAGMLKPVTRGWDWPWPTLTTATYGRRQGEVYALGAGTGIGKTDVFTQIIAQTVRPVSEGGLHMAAAAIYLEQDKFETGRRVLGKLAAKRFHVPDAGWTPEDLIETVEFSERECAPLYLYDHFGQSDWDLIAAHIRFLVVSCGVKHVFLDHLTALAAGTDDERVELERIMAAISGLAQELSFCFYLISHLATPEGKPHEEGGRVMIRHFKGSRAIGFWSHFMFGLERAQQDDDPEVAKTALFRVLKDRYTGSATGLTFPMAYDEDTGILTEGEPDPFAHTPETTTASSSDDEECPF